MKFVDIENLDPRTKPCCIKEGTKMVNNKDIYIREKQKEIFEYYLTARMFLMQANCIDERVIMGLLNKDDYDSCRSIELDLKGNFYECALFYYNALIDLSWVLAYVSLEFACSINGQRVSTEGIDWISKSKAYLEEFEKMLKIHRIQHLHSAILRNPQAQIILLNVFQTFGMITIIVK